MGISYKNTIMDMTWSYSRMNSFGDCPYKWLLKYIYKYKEAPQFLSSFGSFMHKILEKYYKGNISKSEMLNIFMRDFNTDVFGDPPGKSSRTKYYCDGIKYLMDFTPFPYKTMGVEQRINFKIDDIPFIGYIDFVGEGEDGLYIIDHKSRKLSQRSSRKVPTKKDEELDSMLKQLYLYAEGLHQCIGKYPDYLCFNCFRNGVFIKEPFYEEKLHKVLKETKEKVVEIAENTDFSPRPDAFFCNNMCGVRDKCCYYDMGFARK